MKIKRTIRIGRTSIPAGTNLAFSNEGYVRYQGLTVYRNMIPQAALEDFEDEHLGYSEPEESEKVMAAPEIPRITFNFGSQGTELRLARMIAQGLRCQTFVNDKGQNICEVDIPMSAKSAHALCEVLAECGYSGMDIARMWPELAVVAGLYSAELDAMNYKYDIVKNP